MGSKSFDGEIVMNMVKSSGIMFITPWIGRLLV